MISMMKWMLFAIFIFSAFATDNINNPWIDANIRALNFAAEKGNEENVKFVLNELCKLKSEKLIQFLMKEEGDWQKMTALLYAADKGHVKIVKLLLDVFIEEKDKLIQFVMKENENNVTALLLATKYGYEEIVKLLLDIFGENEQDKLIAYLMKEYHNNCTVLIVAAHNGYEGIVKLFLDVFSEGQKDKLIEYVKKENKIAYDTVLHIAASDRLEETVKLLLNVFGKDENVKLVAYLMKKNRENKTALCLASASPPHVNVEIVKLLSQTLTNAKNEIMISNLQQVTNKFKKQNAAEKDKSLLWYLLDDYSCCDPGKETILKFLIIDYSIEMNLV